MIQKKAPNNDKVIKYLTGRGIDIDIFFGGLLLDSATKHFTKF